MAECGCHEEGHSQVACSLHWVVLMLTSFTHEGFCEECCDVPYYHKLIEKWGEPLVRAAIASLPKGRQKYPRRILVATLAERVPFTS